MWEKGKDRKTLNDIVIVIQHRDTNILVKWMEMGLVNPFEVMDLWWKIHGTSFGHWGNPKPINKFNGMSNPCSEISLEEKHKCVIPHPTARVSHYLLIG